MAAAQPLQTKATEESKTGEASATALPIQEPPQVVSESMLRVPVQTAPTGMNSPTGDPEIEIPNAMAHSIFAPPRATINSHLFEPIGPPQVFSSAASAPPSSSVSVAIPDVALFYDPIVSSHGLSAAYRPYHLVPNAMSLATTEIACRGSKIRTNVVCRKD